MEDQPDVASLTAEHPTRESLAEALKAKAQQTQMPVQAMIAGLQSADEVTESTSLWLINAIAVEGTADAIEKLAGAPGVAGAVEDGELSVSSHTDVTVQEVDEQEIRDQRIPSGVSADGFIAENLGEDFQIPQRPEVDMQTIEAPQTPDALPVEASDHAGFGVAPSDGDAFAWGMERVYAPAAHTQGLTGDGVSVAVIDTGIDDRHPDLEVTDFKDFINDFSTPYDDHGHGTHVAGTVAGDGTDGLNTGVAPDVDLIGVKALDSSGGGLVSTVVQAIEWSVENDADIISMSLGGPHADVVHTVLENAADAGVVPVAAAGNGPFPFERDSFAINLRDVFPVLDPGHERDVITVGATHFLDRTDFFSAYDEDLEDEEGTYDKPDVVAPGLLVESTSAASGGYETKTGTSMATPHVAGIAALVLQAQAMSPADVKQTITDNAEDITPEDRDRVSGHGLATARAGWVAQNGADNLDHSAEVHEGTLFLNATLTDANGDPVQGEEVTFNVISLNETWLTFGKILANLYLVEGERDTTDSNGFVSVSLPFDDTATPNNGTFTSEAIAFGNLTRDTDTFREAQIADVGVSVDQYQKFARDDVTVTVDVTEPDSSTPLDANVTVILASRTMREFSIQDTVNTTQTNQVTFTLPDWAAVVLEDGFGSWEILVTVDEVNRSGTWENSTTLGTQLDIFADAFDLRMPWTDMEIKDGRDVEWIATDIITWQGQLAVGETFGGTLTTTQDNDVFDLWLASGPAPDQIIDTVDVSDGEFQTTIPSSHPGGGYLLIAVPTGQCSDADNDGNLDFSGECDPSTASSIGSWDASIVSIRALSASVDFIQKTDSGETLEPGEEIKVRIEFRDPVTGERVDPNSAVPGISDMTQTSTTSVGDGVIEFNAVLDDEIWGIPAVIVSGTDQNGGSYDAVLELGIMEPFRTAITPEENSYEAGEDATFTVSLSHPETGDPIKNADVDFAIFGDSASGSWGVTGTVTTDDFGQADIDFRIPADATEFPDLSGDVFLVAVPQKSDRIGLALSGFEIIEEFPEPRISVDPVGQDVGLLGLIGLSVIEPGESLTFDVEAKGVDASQLEDNDLYADVVALKISQLNAPGGTSLVDDFGASSWQAVHLGDDGKGTHTISVDEHAPPGLYIVFGIAEMNGVVLLPQTLDDFTLGMVGSGHGLDVQAPDLLSGGDELEVGVSGELPAGAEIDLFLERKNSTAQFPALSTPDGFDPGLELLLEQTASAAANQTAVLAGDLEANLPSELASRSDEIVSAFEMGATPLIASMISADGPGGPFHVGSVEASQIDTTQDVSVNMTLPLNVPPGDYQIVARASSDDRVTLPFTHGFADLTIQNDLQTVREFDIGLSAGWNLVSIPVDEEVSVDAIVSETDGAVMKTIRWHPGLSSYQPADTLEPGLGYWVFSADDTSFSVEGVSLDEKDLTVDDRWRLYGSVARTAGLDDAMTQPSDLDFQAVGWNAAEADYEVLSKVAPGQGYWLTASEPGELRLKAPPAPP